MDKKHKEWAMAVVYILMLLGGISIIVPTALAEYMEIGLSDVLNLNLVVGLVIIAFSGYALLTGRWKK